MGDFRVTDDPRATEDFNDMMMDYTEKERSPDDTVSWAAKITGMKVVGRMAPEDMIDEKFVKARLRVEFPNDEDGEPEIIVGEEVLEAMNGLWKNCMIVKVLGRSVPIAILTRKLRELWKPRGTMYVVDLPRQFFMVRFGEEEYLAALTRGPWRAFGGYLIVQAWSPEFDPTRDAIVTTPVWVRLSNLPVNLYHKSILMGIAKGLGKSVRVDVMTLNLERARFARVCVEVDLRKPLKGSVKINNERYYVAYEGMTNICSNCGIYGHLVHRCPSLEVPQQKSPVMEKAIVETRKEGTEEEGFITVRRPNRRSKEQANPVVFVAGESTGDVGRNLQVIPSKSEQENIRVSNRFGNLEVEMIEAGKGEVALVADEDKENHLVRNPNENGKFLNGKSSKYAEGSGKQFTIGRKGNLKGKRAGPVNLSTSNGPRTRSQLNRPTRVFVFGPRQEEVERSSSGKRLRVEGVSVERKEGSLEKQRDGAMGDTSITEGIEVVTTQVTPVMAKAEQEKGKGVQNEQTTSSNAMELSVA
ncbi:uncharacterized protein LOC112084381 [Eutrema salsugineum]|uniref:uncharacterized protein LOC112084381 n=1 Tax=Eutrema salsugineum TaxID=72664 RepID=UPI000CED5949|nr:uncharacterized protein LOC112084381 [Eutrema salsugineum]